MLRGSGCAVRVCGSGGCPRGCPPWGPVPWSHVRWGYLPPALGVAAVSSSSSGAFAVACVVALAAAEDVAWRRGRGCQLRSGVLGGSFGGCSPFLPCGCALLPLREVCWSVGVSQCGSCGVRSVVRRRVLAGVRLLRWGVGRCWSFCFGVPFLCVGLVSVVAPSPSVPQPLIRPLPGPLTVCCLFVVWPPVPCPCGRLPATLGLSSPPCRGVLSLPLPFPCPCPFPSRCAGGGVGGGPVGRR